MNFKILYTKSLQVVLGAGLAILGLSACKDYLEVAPKASPRSDNFFTDASKARLGINGIYNILRKNTFNQGLFPMLDIMTDDGRKGSNPGDALGNVGIPYDQFQLSPTTQNTIDWYTTLYQGVRRANAMIEVLPTVPMTDQERNQMLGEAHFLRALFYLDLTRGFHNIPITLTTLPDGPTTVKQDSGRNVYDQVIKADLIIARDILPEVASEKGRASKGAANGLLARAALYFKDYQTALEASQAVINSGLYGLEQDFTNAFYATGYYGTESVFEVGAIQQEDNNGVDLGGNGYGNVQGVRGSPNVGWGFNRPFIQLLRAFEPGDVRKKKSFIQVGDTMNKGLADQVVIVGDGNTPDFTLGTNPVTGAENDTIEYEMYNEKVWTPGIGTVHNVNSSFGAHRKVIRYADVLLMAAEALVMTGGDLATAANYVNTVRARAREGQAGVLPDVPADGNLLAAIKQERRVELALEGHRFFDLVRWGDTRLMEPFGFKPRNKYLPLPQSEIDISGGHLIQNDGY